MTTPSKRKGDARGPSKALLRYSITNMDGLRARFMQKAQPNEDGCWIWTAYIRPAGYGQIGAGAGKVIDAHRASFLLFHGDIPAGMFVCHHCDVRACVNPEHIYLGTPRDNARDAWDRDRMPVQYGLEASNGRLTMNEVEEIRRRHVPGIHPARRTGGSSTELAREFGITRQYVGQLVTGKWRTVA